MGFSRKTQRSKVKHNNFKEPNYIESLKEWQDKQYVSGYYTGGKMPPFMFDKDSNPLGLVLSANGVLMFGFGLFSCINSDDFFSFLTIYNLFLIILGGLSFYAGITRLGSKRKRKK